MLGRVHREELDGAAKEARPLLKRVKPLIVKNEQLLNDSQRNLLQRGLAENASLAKVYDFKQRLQSIFHERQASEENLLKQLQNWCKHAEESGIAALEEFASVVRAYTLQPS